MELNNIKWTVDTYNEFMNYLYANQDTKYRDFHFKLLGNDNIDLIGIRTPILKNIAKEISKGNYDCFIKLNKHKYYEDNTINGALIGYIRLPFKDILNYIDNFIPYINNWATCDLMCSNLKIFKNNLDEGFIYINKLVGSDNPWSIRVGLVLLLCYYMDDIYYSDIFNIVDNIKSNEYYVNMAQAWLISYCYINNPTITKKYLKRAKMDKFTYNKSIQKIIESYRVDIKDKEELKLMRK